MPPQNDNDTMSEPYNEDLDLGSLTNNKNMLDDMFDDEASQVTVATKNLAKDQHPHDDVPHELSPKTIPHERPIDFELFPVLTAGQDEVKFPKHPTKPRKSRRNRNKNKNKKKSNRKQRGGKQATNGDDNQKSSTGSQATDSQDTPMNDNNNSGSNNSNERKRDDMDENSNK